MKRLTLFAVILLALAGAPSATAAGAFTSDAFLLAGDMVIEGPAAGLLALDESSSLSWEAVAASAVIVREYANRTQVDGTFVELVGDADGSVRHTVRENFGSLRLQSGSARSNAAFLATAGDGGFEVTSTSAGFVGIESADEPTFGQAPVQVDAGPGESPYFGVGATLEGAFVNLTSGAATLELRGTFSFQLFDVDYSVRDATGPSAKRTGVFDLDSTGPVRSSRVEIHTITLTDAVLLLHAPSSTMYAREPTVIFDGTLRATGASGDMALDGVPLRMVGSTAEWRGATALAFSPNGESVRVSSGESIVQGSTALSAARVPWVAAGLGIALTAVAIVLVALLVRRRREAPNLEAALLAMEDRQWGVAIRHFDGLIAQGPADAILLVDRAICLEETGRLVEARASYEDALREQPAHAEAHYYYARVLARLHVSTGALAHLSRALALDDRLIELARKEPAFRTFGDHPQFAGLLAD